jgi:type II secretory pathway pseudopilin PulG
MRRRLSLALLAVFVVLAVVVSTRYLSPRNQATRKVASAAQRDSLARLDSAARADARQSADTMCFASRLFLPCDPR